MTSPASSKKTVTFGTCRRQGDLEAVALEEVRVRALLREAKPLRRCGARWSREAQDGTTRDHWEK